MLSTPETMQAPAAGLGLPPVHSLERRRLQCYLALMLGDAISVFAGFGIIGYLYQGLAGIAQAMILAQMLMPVFLTVALYNRSYSIDALNNPRRGSLRVVTAVMLSSAAVVFIAFYTKSSAEFSRIIFTIGMLASLLLVSWTRAQMRSFVAWRCGPQVVYDLLIDDDGPAVDLPDCRRISASEAQLVPALDDPHALHRIGLALESADRVMVSCPPERRWAWATILKGANISGEVIDSAVAELGAHGARIAGQQGWLRVSLGPLELRSRVIKRLFDILGAGLGLLLLGPLLLVVTVAILLEDGSPVLFVQRRVGRGNRFFNMYKFRSMRAESSDSAGNRSTGREDDRITRVGRFIRRTSIDELPQLINVLLGEMSIVGPRPHALGSQAGTKLFWEVDFRYWQRHALKPGLTGLAQVRGFRGATDHESDLEQRLNADLEYLDGWSLWRDIRIVLGTVRVLIHERAY